MAGDTSHAKHKAHHFGYGGPVSDEHQRKQDEFAEARDDRELGKLIPIEEVIEDEQENCPDA